MTAKGKLAAIRGAEEKPQYSDELTQPLRLVAKNWNCVIRAHPHPQSSEITPYVAQGRVLALQFGRAEIKIENSSGEIVYHAKGDELLYPEDGPAFWRRLGV